MCVTIDYVVNGEFWTGDESEPRMPGQFSAEVGQPPVVSLDAALVAYPREEALPAPIRELDIPQAALAVTAFLPITLYGELETGESVTVLNARGYGKQRCPKYVGDNSIHGALVSGPQQLYSAVRFRIGGPHWFQHLADGEQSTVPDDGSTLRLEAAEDGNWLVYEAVEEMTLRRLQNRVVAGCQVLMQLALDQPLAVRDVEVPIAAKDSWLRVHSRRYCTPTGVNFETLLPREEITIDRFANWIDLNDRLDRLAWPVVNPVDIAVEPQAQVTTSLIEGLHRRLPGYRKQKFPDASKKALDRIRTAVKDSAEQQATSEQNLDPAAVRAAIRAAVGHFEAIDYAERAAEVVAEVQAALPEITETVTDLPARLPKPRNEHAHQLEPNERLEDYEERVLRWMVIAHVTHWLLRALLLLRAGVAPEVLRSNFLDNERFTMHRANIAQIVYELGWYSGSAAR